MTKRRFDEIVTGVCLGILFSAWLIGALIMGLKAAL